MGFLIDNGEKPHREYCIYWASYVHIQGTHTLMWSLSAQGPWDAHKVIYVSNFYVVYSQGAACDNANSFVLVTFSSERVWNSCLFAHRPLFQHYNLNNNLNSIVT